MNISAPKLASIEHPTIAAIVHGLFRFPTRAEALARLRGLPLYFMISRQHSRPAEGMLALWIRGYGLSEEDIAHGYTGQYARVACEETGGKWRLAATPLPLALKRHPQRRYPSGQAHPNWGHPILRRIRQGKPYAQPEDAQAALMALHEQYPHASIPGPGRLHLIVYGHPPAADTPAAPQPDARVHKYVLTIQPLPEGGCRIDCKHNLRRKKPPSADAAPTPPAGFFSTMVKIRRGRKKSSKPDGSA